MEKNRITLCGLLLIAFCAVNAQSGLEPSSVVKSAMSRLEFLAGNWKGSGWIQMGPQRYEFIQTEQVFKKVNGTVLVIDGRGVAADDAAREIHNAFAVISFDEAAGGYLMRAFRADGNYIDADFKVEEDGSIVWGFKHPMAGQIRYQIRNVEGYWIETGEMSRDGNNWMKFLEMKLERE